MNFPFFEIELRPRRLENGSYKAGCVVSEHTGDTVHVILPKWELKNNIYENEDAANKHMIFNVLRYLKREHGLKDKDLEKVKISK